MTNNNIEQLSIFNVDKPCLLLSIGQGYHAMIEKGMKKYEYRRKFVDYEVNAYVYVSSPVMKVMSYVEFDKPIIDSPDKIAEIAEEEENGSWKRVFDYLNGLEKGYAIPIKKFVKIREVSLAEIKEIIPDFHPPQSYIFLDKKAKLKKILSNNFK